MIGLVLTALAGCAGCASGHGEGGASPAPDETALRESLGIPADAVQVVVLSQSSHLDLNFLDTFDGYWEKAVRDVLRASFAILDEQPGYRYSVAEVAWLRRYWDEHPESRDSVRRLASSGALHVVGGGLSSPDSLLPGDESLIRDFLLGIRWTQEHLGVTPRAAWVPDSFGHAPSLPSILEHFHVGAVGLARVDGVEVFAKAGPGKPGGIDPFPGSTAETLAGEGSADWIWRAPDGAEALAHWMPFGYMQGDDLDFSFPWFGVAGFGVDWNRPPFIDPGVVPEHLASHVARLAPLSRTPYLFLPIGIDFSWPKRELLAYVKRWNDERYAATGVWAIAATFDDYVALVNGRRRDLPVLEADASPYFMGFYATHPDLKGTLRRATEALVAAEVAGVIAAATGSPYPADLLDHGWDRSAFMNHHDAITGTSTQEALATDLRPWSADALASGEAALAGSLDALAATVDTATPGADAAVLVLNPSGRARTDLTEVDLAFDPPTAAIDVLDEQGRVLPSQWLTTERVADGRVSRGRLLFLARDVPSAGTAAFAVRRVETASPPADSASPVLTLTRGGRPVDDPSAADAVTLANAALSITLTKAAGWCATALTTADGRALFAGPSLDVVGYFDAGGAYRIGSEVGRDFAERTSVCGGQTPTTLAVRERGPARVSVAFVTPDEAAIERVVSLGAELDRADLAITATPPFASTLVVRLRTPFAGSTLTTRIPFTEVERPRHKLFEPTFWPVTGWVDVGRDEPALGVWVANQGTTGVSATDDGTLDVMLTRDTYWDALGPPNHEDLPYTLRLSVGARRGASWREDRVASRALDAYRPLVAVATGAHAGPVPARRSWLAIEEPDVTLSALKAAQDGSADRIVRVIRHGREPVVAHVASAFAGFAVWKADGLEVAAEPVAADASSFTVTLDRSITTLRLVADAP
ncbi:MAG: hypothetical protein IPK07_33710 [Deltaproteobacteria bacterium]|nr:hypothetical protein [Deltaproteobacteria bacterium]